MKNIIRSNSDGITSNGRTIEGYAVVFGAKSVRMYDWCRDWIYEEYIDKDAISQELLNSSDVKALIDHDRSRLVARCKDGVGSLSLTLDERGLKFSFEAPNTSQGNDLLEMIQRGDLTGCSFAFRCDEEKDQWEKKGKVAKCTRKKITGLYDVSIVTDPAYPDTEVSARQRSIMEGFAKELDGNDEDRQEVLKKNQKQRNSVINNLNNKIYGK